MKIVQIKFKKGIRKPIRDKQKLYYYMCPIDDIKVGEYVILEVKIHGREDFQVGRIEKVKELESWNKKEPLPTGFIVSKVPVKDFEKRCDVISKLKTQTLEKNKRFEKNTVK